MRDWFGNNPPSPSPTIPRSSCGRVPWAASSWRIIVPSTSFFYVQYDGNGKRKCGAGEQSRVGRSVAVGYTVDRFGGLVETDKGTAAHAIPSHGSPPASLGGRWRSSYVDVSQWYMVSQIWTHMSLIQNQWHVRQRITVNAGTVGMGEVLLFRYADRCRWLLRSIVLFSGNENKTKEEHVTNTVENQCVASDNNGSQSMWKSSTAKTEQVKFYWSVWGVPN
jgi:hypothetical protein